VFPIRCLLLRFGPHPFRHGKTRIATRLVVLAVTLTVASAIASDRRWKTAMSAGEAAYAQCNFLAAENYFNQAADQAKRFELSDRRLWQTLDAIAQVYAAQGKYDRAEEAERRALVMEKVWLGPEHPIVASSLDHLGVFYMMAQGRYAEAEPLLESSLAIREKVSGPNHPDVAASLVHLAELYQHQGRYSKADSFLKRSLTIQENALGPQHPAVAATLDDLGLLFAAEGKYPQAESFERRAISVYREALGSHHCELAAALRNYATLLEKMNRPAEADQAEKEAFTTMEDNLRAEDRVALRTHHFGFLHWYQVPPNP
jgi:tetratricopeptide (TPR) repeat protein